MTSAQKEQMLKLFKATLTPERSEKLIEMKIMLNQVFGEENNQIQNPVVVKEEADRKRESTMADNCYRIVIRFPEFVITNSKGKKHTIRDLYVAFFMNTHSLCLIGGLYGMRGELSPQEVEVGYAHSHLPYIAQQFQTFCTGSGPINGVMERLHRATEFDKDLWRAFLYNIRELVIWESLEGTPHNNMSNIGQNTGTRRLQTVNITTRLQATLRRKFLEIPDVHKKLTFNQNFTHPLFGIPDDLNIEFAQVLFNTPAISVGLAHYRVQRDSNGHHYTDTSSSAPARNTTGSFVLQFKDREVMQKTVTPGSSTITTTQTIYYVHPTIISNILNWLNSELQKRAVRLSYTKIQDPAYHNPKAPKPDIPLVPGHFESGVVRDAVIQGGGDLRAAGV